MSDALFLHVSPSDGYMCTKPYIMCTCDAENQSKPELPTKKTNWLCVERIDKLLSSSAIAKGTELMVPLLRHASS